MGIKQVERLYKKMIVTENPGECYGHIDTRVRTAIFQNIMDEVERLLKKLKRCAVNSKEYEDLDRQIRKLLLKEVQVIIDDYVISRENGTFEHWKQMYGDIKHYIKSFYYYRNHCISKNSRHLLNNYGFFDQND